MCMFQHLLYGFAVTVYLQKLSHCILFKQIIWHVLSVTVHSFVVESRDLPSSLN